MKKSIYILPALLLAGCGFGKGEYVSPPQIRDLELMPEVKQMRERNIKQLRSDTCNYVRSGMNTTYSCFDSNGNLEYFVKTQCTNTNGVIKCRRQ